VFANLTQQYEKAEQRYKDTGADEECLDALEDILCEIPKHKGTLIDMEVAKSAHEKLHIKLNRFFKKAFI